MRQEPTANGDAGEVLTPQESQEADRIETLVLAIYGLTHHASMLSGELEAMLPTFQPKVRDAYDGLSQHLSLIGNALGETAEAIADDVLRRYMPDWAGLV